MHLQFPWITNMYLGYELLLFWPIRIMYKVLIWKVNILSSILFVFTRIFAASMATTGPMPMMRHRMGIWCRCNFVCEGCLRSDLAAEGPLCYGSMFWLVWKPGYQGSHLYSRHPLNRDACDVMPRILPPENPWKYTMCSEWCHPMCLDLRGLSVGYKGTLFIFDMNYLGHEDLKKKNNWGSLCKVVLQGGGLLKGSQDRKKD